VLEELRIRDLGVIAEATLPLGPGLTVLTGETGAGKTMVVSSLQLLFGARADSGQVRLDAPQLSVEGLLTAPPDVVADRVRAAGGELDDDGTLILRRVVTGTGRSRAHAGGSAVPVGVLAELGDALLTIHGQSGQVALVRPDRQRAALDRYAGVDLDAYRTAFARWQEAEQRWHRHRRDAAELAAEADRLAFGLEQIERVDPQPGEDEQLAVAAARLAHADAIRVAVRAAHDALVGDDDPGAAARDVQQLLAPATRALAQLDGADPDLDELTARLTTLAAGAADLATDLSRYEANLEADPAELARLEDRRAVLAELIRRYGRPGADGFMAAAGSGEGTEAGESGVGAVLAWAKRAAARHAEIDVSDAAMARLDAERKAARAEATRAALEVSRARTSAAERLGAAVTAELDGLAMAGARIVVTVTPRAVTAGQPSLDAPQGPVGASADGIDDVAFLLRADPTLPAAPVHRGASGGELSRVMLAIEVVLADREPVPTMVFDEVDAGVGGRAAVEVGRTLARLARTRQVIVVTHLAQVAAFADTHLVVAKTEGQPGDTITGSSVRTVRAAEREAELARMLGGSDTRTARRHAAELVAQAAGRGA
jgi:DNA repair protein RecN (Recombination protein N)